MKTNPLNNIKVASPCPANWDEMYGDNKKRYCGECKLNVYNLSGMSKDEAENLIMNAEGRLCVRFFRRQDGTVLTKDCPVGWAKVKQRVSRVATATFSLLVGVFGGLFAFNSFSQNDSVVVGAIAVTNSNEATIDDYDVEPNENVATVGVAIIPIKETEITEVCNRQQMNFGKIRKPTKRKR
ncbi:MAG: hypothetical protein MUC29_11620 [Pyrinomonadaceae bacterium]|jgi:hypothetical protein|nr:hypothetical protein [Pyrinomonadaceae bacterium]